MVAQFINAVTDPGGTPAVVATTLPLYSGFFCQYLIVKSTVSLTIELLRGLTLFHMTMRWLFRAKDATVRERKEVIIGIRRFDNPGWLPYGKHYAHFLLVLMMLLSFAPIAP